MWQRFVGRRGELAAQGGVAPHKNGPFKTNGSLPDRQWKDQFGSLDGKPVFRIADPVYLSQKECARCNWPRPPFAPESNSCSAPTAHGLVAAQVDRVLVAGSFGFHLRTAGLIHLGLLPREFKDRVEFVGNTSKSGARAFLLNRRLRDELKQLVQRVHVLELANDLAFEKTFLKAIPLLLFLSLLPSPPPSPPPLPFLFSPPLLPLLSLLPSLPFHSDLPMKTKKTCSECGALNCYRKDKMFPSFCLTEGADRQVVDKISRRYRGKNPDALIAHAAAEVEGTYYGKLTRVEEIIAFANRIGTKRIGIATCIGLIRETRVFVEVLKANSLEPYTVCCKVGSVDKTEIGIPDELKVKKGSYEAICNPILQTPLLNEQKTDLNVIVGLCVGHDSLFIKHSDAPVTTSSPRIACWVTIPPPPSTPAISITSGSCSRAKTMINNGA